ncbi:phytanoyl-CoA dioxygenase family protein [Microlunatus soli]|uniref:Ectoine hydroxylase-related dioxygenase, phytanoyl-CoA dioxygenase (PhyH) family n=1 Tax=Microlunatus soli TaxID=630515 RepID=A0A1H1YL28_9ACTN|nr:phytanoyl-CoA dioxygenase family protein [Microlunatus soli]SDT22132.1 Ectoine hydroxylase-related dioxygenase, phytanoyl-CoA dioxygenase (PhyH) family [Microlunatus soli]
MTTEIARLPTFETVTDALVDAYQESGCVILREAIGTDLVRALNIDVERLCRGELGTIARASEPAGKEMDAADGLREFLCIHYPHKVSAAACQALSTPSVIDVLTRVIGPNVKVMQSMLFVKAEGKPGQPWHQDEYVIPTRDRSLTAVWIALDDATVDNGCLWVLPGSHRRGVLYPDRVQNDPGFDCSIEAFNLPYADQDAVPVEIPAGAAVIFNGYLLHRSLRNSGRHGYRRGLANHYMSAESLLPWQALPDGSRVGKHDYRDIVLVAGQDPYAYKGSADIAEPHSRPDIDGGCDR